ncbi:hypothetical protein LJC14_03855 [Treponema sp. OttesenSCG-928-L16]|nr:hypothetical protein [Treponema sp. OttesenSCG-928-L16]
MKKLFAAIAALALCSGGMLGALDLTIIGGAGNFSFDTDRETSLSAGGGKFSANYYPLWSVSAEQGYGDNIHIHIGLERDQILRNRIAADIGFNIGIARLDIGPFFGFCNSWEELLSPGMAANVRVEVPGIIFGNFRAGSTIGTGLSSEGDSTQEFGTITVGFWVPNVIASLSIKSRTYTEMVNQGLKVEDSLTKYMFSADVFKKNVPYTLHVDLGYQSLKRRYISVSTDTDELKSFFVGFEGSFQVRPFLKIIAGIEAPVYAWGEDTLKGPGKNTFLFESRLGVSWTIDRNTDGF